jgi:hypothetical protein
MPVFADPDQPESSKLYAGAQVEDMLACAEKATSGCKRDVEFASAALGIGHTKDFTRAFDVAGRIDNDSIKDSVSQFLYYDMAGAAASGDDAMGLDDAQKYAERISTPEQRTMLYVKIARAALRRHDRQLAAQMLADSFAALAGTDVDGALSLARELDDPSMRIRSLISITRAAARKTHGSAPAATRGG